MIEIDILPASTESKGGDSALIRIGSFSYDSKKNDQLVILIDSGYRENADRIYKYLRDHYQTNVIDIAILSHPDMDHISGFKKILEDDVIQINRTYIHDPWNHAKIIFNKTIDGRRTINSIKKTFDESLCTLSGILDNVGEKNYEPLGPIKICEYDGVKIYLLGPSKKYYQKMLYCFPGMEGEVPYGNINIYGDREVLYKSNMKHFLDNPCTSAKNNTSTIILIHNSNDSPIALFTGDAGTEAINEALDVAEINNLAYKNVRLFQIPHHGSIKNISEELLYRISPKGAYVSAPPNKKEHPSRLLLNFINNMDIDVSHIQDQDGHGIRYSYDNAPKRPGWGTPSPFENFFYVYRLIR